MTTGNGKMTKAPETIPETPDNEAISAAAITFLATVRKEFEKWAALQPGGARIREVAKIICERHQFEPDMIIMGHAGQPPVKGPKGTTSIFAPLQPAWALYWAEAIQALDVVRLTEPGPSEEASDAQVPGERAGDG